MKNLEDYLDVLTMMSGENNSRKDDFKIEINLFDGKFLPVEYHMGGGSSKEEHNVFNIFLKAEIAQTYEEYIKKGKKFFLVLTEIHWQTSGMELKQFPGEKKFGECISLDFRKNQNFIKIKIIDYGKKCI